MRITTLLLLGGVFLGGCNLPEATEPATPAAGIIRGVVWNDRCQVEAGAPGESCIQVGSLYQANGVREAGEAGIAGVLVELGAGPCPSRGLDSSTTGSNGTYAFIGHGPGEYCVEIAPTVPLVRTSSPLGRWTTGEPAQTVQLEGGQDLAGIDFGWEKLLVTATGTPRALATTTPTAERAEVTAVVNANCRGGPGIEYDVLELLLTGQIAEPVGRNAAGDWWQVRLGDENQCWVSAQTVEVNFGAGALPLVAAPPSPTPSPGAIGGRVWHDQCGVSGGEAGSPPTPSPGCIKLLAGGYAANGVLEAGEPGLVGVLLSLGDGECLARGLASTITAADGVYKFSGLAAGTYCVSVDAFGAINSTILIPGEWTQPPGVGQITISLSSGERLTEVNFGWDYQFLP